MGWGWGGYGGWSKWWKQPYYVAQNNSLNGRTLTEMSEKVKIGNIIKQITSSIAENVIFVEPKPWIKFYHMMAMAGSQEIYGKLVVEEEYGYVVVKDVLMPYQAVQSAHFRSYDEHMAKWLFELNFVDNDPKYDEEGKATGERRPIEEVNAITSKLNGHFHSHNSLGQSHKPGPSGTDTVDVMEHREDKSYWVEIIGTFGGFSGRIATTNPVRTFNGAEVKLKWWTGIEETLKEADGKIFYDTYSSWQKKDKKKGKTDEKGDKTGEKGDKKGKDEESYDERAKTEWRRTWSIDEQKMIEEILVDGKWIPAMEGCLSILFNEENGEEDDEVEKVIIKGSTTIQELLIGGTGTGYEEGDYEEGGTGYEGGKYKVFVSIPWDEKDPIQMSTEKVPQDVQEEIAKWFKTALKDGERLVVEIYEDNSITWSIYEGEKYKDFLITRLQKTQPKRYREYFEACEMLGYDEEFNSENMSQMAVVRTISYKDALKVTGGTSGGDIS